MHRALAALALVALLTACNTGSGTDTGGNSYIDQYGGSQSVYDRIASLTDCDELQAEFDQAAANNDAAEPGTPQHKQTTGYMTAADDRMKAIGCY